MVSGYIENGVRDTNIFSTFSAHGFRPVHLHQHFIRLRRRFPHFVAELDVHSLFHCTVTLPLTLTTFDCPQFGLP